MAIAMATDNIISCNESHERRELYHKRMLWLKVKQNTCIVIGFLRLLANSPLAWYCIMASGANTCGFDKGRQGGYTVHHLVLG